MGSMAGGPGRALADRPADPVCEELPDAFSLIAGWDRELLGLELGELKLGGFDLALTGFGELELGDLLADRTQGLTDPDDAPEAPEHPVSRTGDLWLLGRHRLL